MSAKSTDKHADLLKEAKRLCAQEASIKRAKLNLAKRMMEAARELGGAELEQEQPPLKRRIRRSKGRRRKAESTPPEIAPLRRVRVITYKGGVGKSWTTTMLGILEQAGRPLTYAELKDAVAKTHLGPKLQHTDKSFYGGLGKLESRNQAFRHKGRVFSAATYERFQRDLAAGLVKDEPAPMQIGLHQSPAKLALLAFLEGHPSGVAPAGIIKVLASRPELNLSDKNGKTAVYNLIARLAKRGELVKEGGLVRLLKHVNGAAPASDNIMDRPIGIEPVRQ